MTISVYSTAAWRLAVVVVGKDLPGCAVSGGPPFNWERFQFDVKKSTPMRANTGSSNSRKRFPNILDHFCVGARLDRRKYFED
jgi:hypothetical protein